MLKTYLLAGAFATMCAGAAMAQGSATTAQQPAQPNSSAQSQATTSQERTATLVGCVYREQDVPGRSPNIAERAGMGEDYILADARPSSSAPSTGSTPSATGTSGTTPTMYKLEQIADERLRDAVGKRVEVTGRIDVEAGDTVKGAAGATGTAGSTADRSLGPDKIELPEFEVSSMRVIEGTCPASPAAR
jgi:hypothetical protein